MSRENEAGNRQQQVETLATSARTQSTTTDYAYNDLDWLTQQARTQSGSSTTTSYGYDANGSQTSVTTQAGAGTPSTIGQQWDFQGHLVALGAFDPATSTWTGSRTLYEVAQSAPLLAAGMNGLEEGTDSMSVSSSEVLEVGGGSMPPSTSCRGR